MIYLWNAVSTSGRVLNDKPLFGTKDQADAYLKIMYDTNQVKMVDADIVDLNAIVFEKENNRFFKAKEGEGMMSRLFDGEINPEEDAVLIYGEDEIPSIEVSINNLLMFPNFIKLSNV